MGKRRIYELEIYNFNHDSWNVVHVTPDWEIECFNLGVSLKGNTYWYARDMYIEGQAIREFNGFLVCFDFTTEKFGPHLPLPFHPHAEDTVSLSGVREEQLAVLFQRRDTFRMEIWVTTKIEPREVSWNKLFLAVEMRHLTCFPFELGRTSFFIDEKNKVVVVLGKDPFNHTGNLAYIIGNDGGYFKEVNLGESNTFCWPLVCSYVPSSVQIKQPTRLMPQHQHHSVSAA